jgi:hypothetical protein
MKANIKKPIISRILKANNLKFNAIKFLFSLNLTQLTNIESKIQTL